MKRVAVLTSGGDSPGMNAAIRAVTRTCLFKGYDVYGIRYGYRGLYDDEMEFLQKKSVSEKINHGGTFLGTSRFEDLKNDEVAQKCANNLLKRDIQHLVVIGGDGSYRGAHKLGQFGIKVYCLPGTIDNDIASSKLSIGFDTATNTVVEAIDRIKDSSSSHSRCSIVEVMGKNCGDIALHAGIAVGAEAIITNKEEFSFDKVVEIVDESYQARKANTIIVVTENICNVIELAKYVEDKTTMETRSTILGYIQRGGVPSALDRFIASSLGAFTVELIEQDIENISVGTTGLTFYYTDLAEALEMEADSKEKLVRLSNYLV